MRASRAAGTPCVTLWTSWHVDFAFMDRYIFPGEVRATRAAAAAWRPPQSVGLSVYDGLSQPHPMDHTSDLLL